MADMNINPIADVNAGNNYNPVTAPRTAVRPDAAGTNAPDRAAGQKDDRVKQDREGLENVVSVSKDGDTVQASDQGMEKLEEDAFGRMVVQKDDEASGGYDLGYSGELTKSAIAESAEKIVGSDSRTEEAIKESIEKMSIQPSRTEEAQAAGAEQAEKEEAEEEYNAELNAEKLASFEGVSDMKLEQMYLQGEISKTDYDKEMESREETREAENADDGRFSVQMTGAAALKESGERDLSQIENVFSGEANDNIAPADRMQIIESLDANTTGNVTEDTAGGEETAKKIVITG
ncbi:MAG TPA: hypothetical protein DCZ52_00960 [Lachnospiraceae bacterium]|nr:hypothetical protein [Lachnospiraceae bacterium]